MSWQCHCICVFFIKGKLILSSCTSTTTGKPPRARNRQREIFPSASACIDSQRHARRRERRRRRFIKIFTWPWNEAVRAPGLMLAIPMLSWSWAPRPCRLWPILSTTSGLKISRIILTDYRGRDRTPSTHGVFDFHLSQIYNIILK